MTDASMSEPPEPTGPEPTDPEDRKIIILAKSALARTGSAQGAAFRDTDGRTYAGSGVDLEQLKLSAVQVVVAMAISSGAQGVEAVAVAGAEPSDDDLRLIGALPGSRVLVWSTDPAGSVRSRIELP